MVLYAIKHGIFEVWYQTITLPHHQHLRITILGLVLYNQSIVPDRKVDYGNLYYDSKTKKLAVLVRLLLLN
jgi:hypothetical protein